MTNNTITSTTTLAASLASTTTLAALVAQKPAHLSLYITGMDYSLLQAQAEVRLRVVQTIKAGVAFGQSFSESAVTVELSSGSVIVTLAIQTPAGTTFVTLKLELTAIGPAIANRVLKALRLVPGINSVLTGVLGVQVNDGTIDRPALLPEVPVPVPVLPAVVPVPVLPAVVPAPHGSMPFDLNAAMTSDVESSMKSGAYDQWSTFFTISLVGLVASVAGVSYALSKRKPTTTVDEEVALVECVEE